LEENARKRHCVCYPESLQLHALGGGPPAVRLNVQKT
jgi:hypothetical protein